MNAKMITIIIPAYNEAENLTILLERIDNSLKEAQLSYSVIIVDDHSTDKTVEVATALAKRFSVRVLQKGTDSPRGKASSLLYGISHAKTDLLAMIDADLQYPPEAIPKMAEKIKKGADVVVANRKERYSPFVRKLASKLFRKVFCHWLHGFDSDVQSGLKVFRKEITDRVQLAPGRWMFDLELLIAAVEGGYKIDTVNITFDARHAGKPKIDLISASVEMAISALQLKFRSSRPIPFHSRMSIKKGEGFHFRGREYIHHTTLPHNETAFYRITTRQIFVMSGLLGVVTGGLILSFHTMLILIVASLTVVYFLDFIFNMFIIYRSFANAPELRISQEEIDGVSNSDWPKYTIFCPLYKEWNVLTQFVTAMSRLDYPTDKLQVMLLLEEDDTETINYAKDIKLPTNFDIVIVPHSFPKTKPKASNYGLTKAKGEFIVIYDAEDVPDPLQLKKSVLAFKKADKKVICIQAKLNFYNPHHNILTRLFTAEYSLWFDLVLTGLQSIRAPIPLGGTSNHFRTADLHMLNGWDSFNVTEDCDLGMRLVKRGYRTAIMESVTNEEANSDPLNWFHQRSRWIKGYIQTYLVHMRRPLDFVMHWNEPHTLTFQLVVGGKILALFINPFMWVLTISYFALRSLVGEAIESLYPAPVFYMAAFSLVFGNFLYMYYYMIGCAKREHYELIKYTFFVPMYWLFMSIASWRALYQIVVNPHYWAKTKHGLHLQKDETTKKETNSTNETVIDTDIKDKTILSSNRLTPSF